MATRDEFLFNNFTFIHFVLCVNVLAIYVCTPHESLMPPEVTG